MGAMHMKAVVLNATRSVSVVHNMIVCSGDSTDVPQRQHNLSERGTKG